MSRPYKREQDGVLDRRFFGIQFRASETGGKRSLVGHAAVFEQETVLVPRNAWWDGSPEIREVIERGAFRKSIRESDQRAVWNHNTDIVLGRRTKGTLDLSEDETGLLNEIFPPDTDLVRDMVIAPIDRGDVDQMSFAFRTIREEIKETRGPKGTTILIRLQELDLVEVSPVAIPQYAGTDIALSARSVECIDDLKRRFAAKISAPDGQTAHPEKEPAAPAVTQPIGESDPAVLRHPSEAKGRRERLLQRIAA